MQNASNFSILNYKEIGEGKTVVFLHGFLESRSMWDVLHLSKLPIRSLLIDLPGHGDSKIASYPYPSIDWMADQVLLLLRELKIQSFDVVGHSMGGYVALSIKKKSLACEKVVLLNSNFWEDTPEKKIDRIRVAEIVLTKKKEFIKQSIPNLFSVPENFKTEIDCLVNEANLMEATDIAFSALAMSQRLSHFDLLNEFHNDFYIVQGELDALIPLKLMQENLSALKKVKLEILANVGHMAHLESSSKVFDILNEILI
jgi:pimeloyl-ACP methyl ester carboxylesterase